MSEATAVYAQETTPKEQIESLAVRIVGLAGALTRASNEDCNEVELEGMADAIGDAARQIVKLARDRG